LAEHPPMAGELHNLRQLNLDSKHVGKAPPASMQVLVLEFPPMFYGQHHVILPPCVACLPLASFINSRHMH
jgi:hypothetical protein